MGNSYAGCDSDLIYDVGRKPTSKKYKITFSAYCTLTGGNDA